MGFDNGQAVELLNLVRLGRDPSLDEAQFGLVDRTDGEMANGTGVAVPMVMVVKIGVESESQTAHQEQPDDPTLSRVSSHVTAWELWGF